MIPAADVDDLGIVAAVEPIADILVSRGIRSAPLQDDPSTLGVAGKLRRALRRYRVGRNADGVTRRTNGTLTIRLAYRGDGILIDAVRGGLVGVAGGAARASQRLELALVGRAAQDFVVTGLVDAGPLQGNPAIGPRRGRQPKGRVERRQIPLIDLDRIP